jgi:hypothetical protein
MGKKKCFQSTEIAVDIVVRHLEIFWIYFVLKQKEKNAKDDVRKFV